MKTVLLLYPDLGFTFWLGQTLDRVGYQTFPARSVSDARFIVQQCRLFLDLIVFNPALPEAAEYVEEYRQFNPSLRTIIVMEGDLDFPAVPADGYRLKPAVIDDFVGADWVQFVGVVLAGQMEQSYGRSRPI